MRETEYLIETRGLTRRFGNHVAVSKLNLLVPKAGVYGFLGPNGAGKTTAIRMLLGLIRPDAGEVRLFGQTLNSNQRTLMSRVGALVEALSLYPHLTGRENLEVTQRLLGSPRELIIRGGSSDRKVLPVAVAAEHFHRWQSHERTRVGSWRWDCRRVVGLLGVCQTRRDVTKTSDAYSASSF